MLGQRWELQRAICSVPTKLGVYWRGEGHHELLRLVIPLQVRGKQPPKVIWRRNIYIYSAYIRPDPMLCPARVFRLAMSCWVCVQVCDFGHLRCYAVLRTCCRRVSKLADDLFVGVCFCRKYVRCLLSHIWWAKGFCSATEARSHLAKRSIAWSRWTVARHVMRHGCRRRVWGWCWCDEDVDDDAGGALAVKDATDGGVGADGPHVVVILIILGLPPASSPSSTKVYTVYSNLYNAVHMMSWLAVSCAAPSWTSSTSLCRQRAIDRSWISSWRERATTGFWRQLTLIYI